MSFIIFGTWVICELVVQDLNFDCNGSYGGVAENDVMKYFIFFLNGILKCNNHMGHV
jgi:hypothetical protein